MSAIDIQKPTPIEFIYRKKLSTFINPKTKQQVHQLWENYKFQVMMNANKRIFQRMLEDDYPRPLVSKKALSVPDSDSDCNSFLSEPAKYSTAGNFSAVTEQSVMTDKNQQNSIQINERIQRRELSVLEEKILLSLEKKVKMLFQMICFFENQLRKDAEEPVSQEAFFNLQKMNRMMILSTLTGSAMFKNQHSEQIGMAITLISSIKMGLSKKGYLRSLNKFCKKSQDKISPIRKSKPFIILKELIKSSEFSIF